MIDRVDMETLWAALAGLRSRVDGQSVQKLRLLAELAERFPGRVEEEEEAGVLSDAIFDPGLMAHVTAEPHVPFPDACSARAALADHFKCDPDLIVVRFEPAHAFLGAHVPGASATVPIP